MSEVIIVSPRSELKPCTFLVKSAALVSFIACVSGCSKADRSPASSVVQILFEQSQPVPLVNCEFKRYGDEHDGGYVMCANLLSDVQVAYSYGIDGRDEWGCVTAKALGIAVHQYDCFNLKRPACDGGEFFFHEECIGDQLKTEKKRTFDTLENQIKKNSDQDKRLLVKMDVEGAEWTALLATPDAVLAKIDQLVIELHGVDEEPYVRVMDRLARTFDIANVHFNNNGCSPKFAPFPSRCREALFVNKRLGIVDADDSRPVYPNPLDAPNVSSRRDCQLVFYRP
jgi:hypothetical protein